MEKILGWDAHARILYAYLSRLTQRQLDAVAADALAAHRASLHEGVRAQLAAQEQMMFTVIAAASHLTEQDQTLIEETIRRALANPEVCAIDDIA